MGPNSEDNWQIDPLDLLKLELLSLTETKYIKPNTKTQNIFCFVNENLTNVLYTLTGGDKKTKGKKTEFSFFKCIQKSNVIKKKFGF